MQTSTFAEIYAAAGFDPKDEDIRQREAGAAGLLKKWTKGSNGALIRIALGEADIASAEYDWFVSAFLDKDRSITSAVMEREASVLAICTLALLVGKGDAYTSNALLAACFMGNKKLGHYAQLIDLAQQTLANVQQSWHLRSVIPKLVAAPDFGAMFEPAATRLKENNTGAAGEALITAAAQLKDFGNSFNALKGALEKHAENAKLMDEEIQSLWWMLGGTSRLLNIKFSELPAGSAALLAGYELAGLSHYVSGAVGAPAILQLVISAGRTAVEEKISLATAVHGLPVAVRKQLHKPVSEKKLEDICHIGVAFGISAEAEDADDWKAQFKRKSRISADTEFRPIDLAVQAYREKLAIWLIG